VIGVLAVVSLQEYQEGKLMHTHPLKAPIWDLRASCRYGMKSCVQAAYQLKIVSSLNGVRAGVQGRQADAHLPAQSSKQKI
jgi:hypothetical protein